MKQKQIERNPTNLHGSQSERNEKKVEKNHAKKQIKIKIHVRETNRQNKVLIITINTVVVAAVVALFCPRRFCFSNSFIPDLVCFLLYNNIKIIIFSLLHFTCNHTQFLYLKEHFFLLFNDRTRMLLIAAKKFLCAEQKSDCERVCWGCYFSLWVLSVL